MANNFEYKIHVSIDQNSIKGDVRQALSDMAKEIKNNALKIELTGDPKDLIRQLYDLQKLVPELDLTKGLEFHLSDAIKEDTDLGKRIISNLTTHVIDSVKEMMVSIDEIKNTIAESERSIDRLKGRRKELYDDGKITNATQAYEAAEKRFIEASSNLEKAGQDKTRLRAIEEMKSAYQDMVNLEKEAGREANKGAKNSQTLLNMEAMIKQVDTQYKIGKDKFIKLSEIRDQLLETKPTGNTYSEMLGAIDAQILEEENRLRDLKKNLENAQNPELKVKGKLADNFITDLQSQLDALQGIEVKVKPKIDKGVKLEVEVEAKPDNPILDGDGGGTPSANPNGNPSPINNANTKIKTYKEILDEIRTVKQEWENTSWDNSIDEKAFNEKYNIIKSFVDRIEVLKSKLDKFNQDNGTSKKSTLLHDLERSVNTKFYNPSDKTNIPGFDISKDVGGYGNSFGQSLQELKTRQSNHIKVLNEYEEKYREVLSRIETDLDKYEDLQIAGRTDRSGKPILSKSDYNDKIKKYYESGEKELAAYYYSKRKELYPKAGEIKGLGKDFFDNYQKNLEGANSFIEKFTTSKDFLWYKQLESAIQTLKNVTNRYTDDIDKLQNKLKGLAEITKTLDLDFIDGNEETNISKLDAEIEQLSKRESEILEKRNEILSGDSENKWQESKAFEQENDLDGISERITLLKVLRDTLVEYKKENSDVVKIQTRDKLFSINIEDLRNFVKELYKAKEAVAEVNETTSTPPSNLHDQNLNKQIEFYKEFKKVAQEYWDLQGKAMDSDYTMSDAEEKRLDKITPKYNELYKILSQYSNVKVKLKNGEEYDLINGDPSDWTAKANSIKDIVFELKEEASATHEAAEAERELDSAREGASDPDGVSQRQQDAQHDFVEYVKKSDYEIYKSAVEMAKNREKILEDLAQRELDIANKTEGETRDAYAKMANSTLTLGQQGLEDGDYHIDDKIIDTKKLIDELSTQIEDEKDPKILSSLNEQLDAAKIKLIALTEAFPKSSDNTRISASDALSFGSEVIDEYARTQRERYQVGNSHYDIVQEEKEYWDILTKEIKTEDDLTRAIENQKQALVELSKKRDEAEKKALSLNYSDPNYKKAQKEWDDAAGIYYDEKMKLYNLRQLKSNWGKSADQAPVVNASFLNSEWRESDEHLFAIDNEIEQIIEAEQREAEQARKTAEEEKKLGEARKQQSSKENAAESEPDINKVRDTLGKIMDQMNTSQITGRNLFDWIKENATDAEKELLGVSKGYEEFQKLLVGASFGSRGLFEYRDGAGLDIFNYNRSLLSEGATTTPSQIEAVTEAETEMGNAGDVATDKITEGASKARIEITKLFEKIVELESQLHSTGGAAPELAKAFYDVGDVNDVSEIKEELKRYKRYKQAYKNGTTITERGATGLDTFDVTEDDLNKMKNRIAGMMKSLKDNGIGYTSYLSSSEQKEFVPIYKEMNQQVDSWEQHLSEIEERNNNLKGQIDSIKQNIINILQSIGNVDTSKIDNIISVLNKLNVDEKGINHYVDRAFEATTNKTPDSSDNTTESQVSQLEHEFEARERNVQATNEQAEAERALRASTSNSSNVAEIDQQTEALAREEEQAKETAEAERELKNERNGSSSGHVYKNQSGDVPSGNYSYDRYGDKPNLAEKYHGVVTTNEDGNTQVVEKLRVDYDKLLSEILKYDAQIYKNQQDINNAQGDTTGLEKKKKLLEDQLEVYTDLMQRIVSEPDFVTNADQKQLDYIKQRRDLQTEILKADTLIAQAKQNEANKQNAINAQIKIQEDAYRQMWELRTKIRLADDSKDPAKISDWKNKLSAYKNIYDNATQTLKQLDAQVAKEQELISLAKIRGEIVSKYDSERASLSDKTRADNIAASKQKERAAYKEYWEIQKNIAKLNPQNQKDAGEIARLKERAKEQRDIYKTEMQNLQAIDQQIAKEEALNNIVNIRKQAIKDIKDIRSANQDKDTDAQINRGIAAQKKIGSLQGLRYQMEKNPYIDNSNPLFGAIDSAIGAYQKEIDTANKLTKTKEQQKQMDDALTASKLAYQKAVAKVTEAENKQNEAGKRQDQQLASTRSQLLKTAAALTSNGKLMKVYGEQVKTYMEEIQNPTTTLERLNDIRVELNKISAEATVAGQSGKSFFQILKQRATSLVAYLGTFASFYRVVGYVKQAISTIQELDTTLIDLRKTTSMSTSELNQFYKESSNIAKQLGVTSSQIIQQAADWSRLGYSTREAATEMSKLSSLFATVSPGMTTENSTDYLVSTMQAYGIEVEDVQRKILDNVNAVGNAFATTNAEIGEMLTRSSAAMNAANNTLEETIALESAAVQITRNAETTGKLSAA